MRFWWILIGLVLGVAFCEATIKFQFLSITGNGMSDPWVWMLVLILGVGLSLTPYLSRMRELLIGMFVGYVVATYFLNPEFFSPSVPHGVLSILSGGIV